MYNANVVIVLQYFDKKKGLASAVSTAGVSTGAILGAWIIYYGLNEVIWFCSMFISINDVLM